MFRSNNVCTRVLSLSQGKRLSFFHTALTWWFSDVINNEKCLMWRPPRWHKTQKLSFFTSSLLPLCLFDRLSTPCCCCCCCLMWRPKRWHKAQTLRFFTSSLHSLCLFDSIINPLLLLLLTIYTFIITFVLMLTRITTFRVVNRLLLFLVPIRTDNDTIVALQS